MAKTPPRRRRGLENPPLPSQLAAVNLNAAAIDVGATMLHVAIPPDRDPQPVRTFSTFTYDLENLANWLEEKGIDTVVMESTGNFWIPVFELLTARGFETLLTDPYRLKTVPGRKSDIKDCQWMQQLHTYGLLSGAFRPPEQVLRLRTYMRLRARHVAAAARQIVAMQDALTLMNIKLQHAVNDLSGVTGMAIIRAILAGERNPQQLATLRDPHCKNSVQTIAHALEGTWQEQYLFELRQAVDSYDHYRSQIGECDAAIDQVLEEFEAKADPADLPPLKKTQKRDRKDRPGTTREDLYRICGVDVMSCDGIKDNTALVLVSEIGMDVTPWPTEKRFASWLGICPANDISGGKVIRRRKRRTTNRAAQALRLAASNLHHSQSSLGAYFRRKRAQIGVQKAIEATAHKLARIWYQMMKNKTPYTDIGEEAYNERYRAHRLAVCAHMAKALGMRLVW